MAKKTIEDINVAGKKVLCRVDFNVPLKDGQVSDDKRIVAALPTIKYLLEHNAKVILCSHLGRPAGTGYEEAFSLAPVGARLSELLPDTKIWFCDDCIGDAVKATIDDMKEGEIVLLENVRFYKKETKNDPEFAKELASLADIYVSDAFGTVHRAHASTAGVAAYLPAVAGFLIGKELGVMGKALDDPERPFTAILGGAKVADKLSVIENLLGKVDTMIIGGGMAYTFLKAKGYEIGTSLLDDTKIEYCAEMMKKAEEKGVKFLLPIDTVCIKEFPNPIDDATIGTVVVDADKIPADMQGCDIGPKTVALFSEAIKASKTVVWNGPMGVFENPVLAKGTFAIANAMAESDAITIIGGGDSASAVKKAGVASKMTHISTGGGASLEYLEGKVLPGVAVLNDK